VRKGLRGTRSPTHCPSCCRRIGRRAHAGGILALMQAAHTVAVQAPREAGSPISWCSPIRHRAGRLLRHAGDDISQSPARLIGFARHARDSNKTIREKLARGIPEGGISASSGMVECGARDPDAPDHRPRSAASYQATKRHVHDSTRHSLQRPWRPRVKEQHEEQITP